MAVLHIVTVPDERLTKACADVDFNDKRVLQLAHDLLDTMVHRRGRGLAAPQVGALVRMFAMRLDDKLTVVCNPTIVRHGNEVAREAEGCLSIPGKFVSVPRYRIIEVDYFDAYGVQQPTLKLRGINARCAQHEIDHLAGVLITNY
jgi:peptide deformylase